MTKSKIELARRDRVRGVIFWILVALATAGWLYAAARNASRPWVIHVEVVSDGG